MDAQQNALTVGERKPPTELAAWSPSEVMGQIQMIQRLMKDGMHNGEHYGIIPGCGSKPALLKSGAEKLGLMFRLAPRFDIQVIEMGSGHREYRINCSLYHINTEKFWGSGVGSCSTLESKYRYRSGAGENTGIPVPKDYWDLRRANPKKAREVIGDGFMAQKTEEGWFIFTRVERQENPDIADTYNTVLKMAKKRAQVDAMLTATAASDIFTQDVEEEIETDAAAPARPAPTKINKAQATDLYNAAKAKGIKGESLLAKAGVTILSELTNDKLPEVRAWVDAQVPAGVAA